jgi:hypothetical protein
MTDLHKFNVGQIFKLTPNARTKWLVWACLNGSCNRAIRTDGPIGKAIVAWLENGKSGPLPFSNKELYMQSKDFWPHHLETASEVTA